MKGLSSLERIILECIGNKQGTYDWIQTQTGLHENVCFNVIQALVIRGIIVTDGSVYRVSDKLSPLILEEINGQEAKEAESLELMEAVMEQKSGRVFRIQKVALDPRDEKIFLAMLSNLESFLMDSHRKSSGTTPLKDRKVVFWGLGDVKNLLNQIVAGRP